MVSQILDQDAADPADVRLEAYDVDAVKRTVKMADGSNGEGTLLYEHVTAPRIDMIDSDSVVGQFTRDQIDEARATNEGYCRELMSADASDESEGKR